MNQHNPGKIIKDNNYWQWQTELGPHILNLDIVPLPQQNDGQQIGIASFVVMEQDQNFLDYVSKLLAESIIKQLDKSKHSILVTAEAKGSHLIPWVWKNINDSLPQQVHERIIVLRKGQAKVYMKNPASISYQSITSTSSQQLNLPPKDKRLLKSLTDFELIFVDDFIGKGGTIVAVYQLFENLGSPAPKLAAVIGSDSNLYQQTFADKQIKVKLIPDPLLLKLPTFVRTGKSESWEIKEN